MAKQRDNRSLMQRWLPHPLMTLLMVVLWLLLQNGFSLGALVMGLLLGVIIPVITSGFWPDRPPIRSHRKALSLLLLVAWDVIVSNIVVARLILFRRTSALHTRWICVPLELTSPEAITLLSSTVTMTPGTVSADLSADGKSLLVHCLDAADAEQAVRQIKQRYEARIKEILE